MTDTPSAQDTLTIGGTLHSALLPKLRVYLIEGHIAEGERIPERELCEAFGMSRTPMREALKVLASEGLIELLPRRGARMKVLSVVEIGELFDIAGGLEALAGRLACEKMTDTAFARIEDLHREMYTFFLRSERSGYFAKNQAVHEAIFDAAGNASLSGMALLVKGRLQRVRYAANAGDEGGRWRTAVREHEEILDALRRRNADESASLLFAHFRHTRDAVLQLLT
jgi:DNA-binding GntR family transcriptional regulator